MIVQMRDQRTGRFVKVDRLTGRVIQTKQTDGPFEGLPIVESVRRKQFQTEVSPVRTTSDHPNADRDRDTKRRGMK